MRKLITATAMLALVGCANIETPLDDGYQPGDLTRTAVGGTSQVLLLRQAYCDGGDMIAKNLLLMTVRAALPGYPEDGLCMDLIEAYSDARIESRDSATSVD